MFEDSNIDEASDRLFIDETAAMPSSSSAAEETTASSLIVGHSSNSNNSELKQPKMAGTTPKTTRKGHRITEYIEDKSQRIRSYFRRRHVPFKRAFDMDLQCGTQSLLIQICDDIEECLYYGHDSLVQKFLTSEGINFVYCDDFISEEKRKLGRFASEDPDILEALGKKRRKSTVKNFDEDDDEFSPTVKEKERRQREKRKEAAKRVQEGDYLSNITERTKAFKSRQDQLIGKIRDTDGVCGTKSFLVVVNMDQEAAFYHGDPHLVSQFFTSGVSRRHLNNNFNVRVFEPDEETYNSCSAPHCLVTRNSLSRWRLAAIKMFKFPKSIPMTLYLCPEADRERWLAELDIDPSKTSVAKLAVCSLHFREGLPTDQYPLPTELLAEKSNEKVEFKGTRLSTSDQDFSADETSDTAEDGEQFKFSQIASKKVKKPIKERMKMAVRARRIRRQWIPGVDFGDKKSMNLRRKKIIHGSLFGSLISCRFCRTKFLGTKQYFQHVKKFHLPGISKCDLTKIAQENLPTMLPTSSKKKTKPTPVTVTPEEKAALLSMMYPKNRSKPMNPRKKYQCAVCKSACDLFGLFFHMKKVHQGLLCCYCTKLFKKVSDLETHIRNAHRVPKRYYHNTKQFVSVSGSKYHLVCSICSDIISTKELDQHACKVLAKKQFDCPNQCGRVFPGPAQLEVHLCNGWCKEMHWLNNPAVEDCRKLYKVLTGKDSDPAIFQETPTIQKEIVQQQPQQQQQQKKVKYFSVSDRRVLEKFNTNKKDDANNTNKKPETENDSVKEDIKAELVNNLPSTGSIFHSIKARGLSAALKKEIRENGAPWQAILTKINNRSSTDENDTAAPEKSDTEKQDLVVAENINVEIIKLDNNFCINHQVIEEEPEPKPFPLSSSPQRATIAQPRKPNRRFGPKLPMTPKEAMENKENNHEESLSSLKISIPIKKESKSERISRASKDIPANFERLRGLLDHFGTSCLFCQQSQTIQVDAIFLLSHLLILHDRQIVKQFLNEDAQDSIFRIKNYMKDTKSKEMIFSYRDSAANGSEPDLNFKCCYCCDSNSQSYEALFEHLNIEHNQKVLTCHLCQNIFLNYGSFRSHVCFGPPSQNSQIKAKFSCMFCYKPDLSTFLDFQKHVRQNHHTCEICLHNAHDQTSLYHHCLNHSQELMCMKCFLTYDNHQQFRKHLFYKHEDEHQVCASCHQKTWPHVYHFCIEPELTTCEVCEASFNNFKKYRVHLRTHTGATPYVCSVRGCKKSYVSKQLLLKHQIRRHPELRSNAATELESRRNKKYLEKMGASSIDHVQLCQDILGELLEEVIKEPIPAKDDQQNDEHDGNSNEVEHNQDITKNGNDDGDKNDETMEEEFDPIASAVASIMGPDGNFDIRKSPVKPIVPTSFMPRNAHPIAMPPLVPNGQHHNISASKTNSSTSLLRSFRPQHHATHSSAVAPSQQLLLNPKQQPVNVDPLKMMLEKKQTLPEPSDILPPSSYKDIIKGTTTSSEPSEKKSEENLDNVNPVLGGLWNQDLFVSNADETLDDPQRDSSSFNMEEDKPKVKSGCKIMKPRYQIEDAKKTVGLRTNMPAPGLKTLPPTSGLKTLPPATSGGLKTLPPVKKNPGAWEVLLSESSGSDNEENNGSGPKKPRIKEKSVCDLALAIKEHDYCYAAYMMSKEQPKKEVEDLSEMDKILSNVALGAMENEISPKVSKKHKKKKEGKKKKKKRKKHRKKDGPQKDGNNSSSSSDSEGDIDVTTTDSPNKKSTASKKRYLPKPKYHIPGTSQPATASAARPRFSSSEGEDDEYITSGSELASSDLDTDFSADEMKGTSNVNKRAAKPSLKATAFAETEQILSKSNANTADIVADDDIKNSIMDMDSIPSLKLKIKLPQQQLKQQQQIRQHQQNQINPPTTKKKTKKKALKRKKKGEKDKGRMSSTASVMSKKMRESLALNRASSSSDSSDYDSDHLQQPASAVAVAAVASKGYSYLMNNGLIPTSAASGALIGQTQMIPQTDNKLYCVCQSPHDDVSEMIGCDAPDCRLEWFHFECVGIMVPPEGQWYCPECTKRYNIRATY